MSFFDEDDSTPTGYTRRRAYEGRRASNRRYGFWILFMVAAFALILGVLIGAASFK